MRFSFDSFVLDADDETLVRDGVRIVLRGKAFAVLRVLLEHAGTLVTREQLLEAVWSDSTIHEQGLSVCIKEIREALGDDARASRFIKTEHRRGYRVVVPVTTIAEMHSLDTVTHDERIDSRPRHRVSFVWSVGRPLRADVSLVDGALDLGRGPLGKFVLEDRTVSRRHVRVTCVADRWRVEDCRSHNGTWVNGVPLSGRSIDAQDGALIRTGETIGVLVSDARRSADVRTRCTILAAASEEREARASFVEAALLDADAHDGAAFRTLIERSCAGSGGPLTAADWSRAAKRS